MSVLSIPGWVHPLKSPVYPESSGLRFGAARSGDRPAECGQGHCGIDMLCAEGTPVYAAHEGVVVTAQTNEVAGGSAGRYISISHAGGVAKTYYIHLDQLYVKAKQTVSAGQAIGTVGRTGVTSSPTHLHFAFMENGKYIDPEAAVRSWPTGGGSIVPFLAMLAVAWWAWKRLF